MKIIADAKSFSDAIQWATKSFDVKNDKAYVALTVDEEGFGFLSHTNLTSHLKAPFTVLDVDAGKKGVKIALEGRYLQKLAGALGVGQITIKQNDEGAVTVKTKTGNFSVPTLSAKVPSYPEVISVGEVSEVEYFDTLQRIAKLCDPGNAGLHPALGLVTIQFDEDKEKVTMMATDRFTLGEVVLDFTPSTTFDESLPEGQALFPYENAVMVAPTKGGTTVELVYEQKAKKFGYKFTDGRVALFALKEAKTFQYEGLKKAAQEGAENSFITNTKDLQRTIAQVSNLDWTSNLIVLEISEDHIVVTDELNRNRMEIEAEEINTDESYTIRFVRSVINSSFSPISTSRVKINFKDTGSPLALEAVLDNDDVADNIFVLTVPKT